MWRKYGWQGGGGGIKRDSAAAAGNMKQWRRLAVRWRGGMTNVKACNDVMAAVYQLSTWRSCLAYGGVIDGRRPSAAAWRKLKAATAGSNNEHCMCTIHIK